ncbi:hypothetical protein L6164_021950 [Bauhinia variegata]|uniref:Uncharacterized protein n=1 Tax=Bauhinia variegata TaxID=167791 RepID=A0ACB9MFK3_BAUVA|nr:hypothetical protein L6164_021950 [Bauhinia variegata]
MTALFRLLILPTSDHLDLVAFLFFYLLHMYLNIDFDPIPINQTFAMGAGEGATSFRSLQDTPTWALATVCFVIISVSIFIDLLIHLVCSWLKRHRHVALFEAVQKFKSGLMILGFMSLLLTVIQRRVAKICIPAKVAYSMIPCHKQAQTTENMSEENKTRLVGHCESQGKSSLISEEGINQLSIFFFVLAVTQIVYCVLTMALGRAKMRRWKSWEKETRTLEYQVANDPNRFRFTRQTTFGRRHTLCCAHTSLGLWTKCFFRQFFHSVAKVDYLTLRHGFITAHLSDKLYFNFQKYIESSLEDDFKVVVGIRPFMWILVVIFMLLAVHDWKVYLWISLLPPAIVLVLGTKMEVIVTKMALQLTEQNGTTKGAPLVQPNNDLFWFGHPNLILTLIHITLFLNAFEVAFFIWVTLQFGIDSCYHEDIIIIIIRVVLAVLVQVVCSYITLPLYALVTQMGSGFKSAVMGEQIANVMKKWHGDVRKKRQKQQQDSDHARSPETSSNSRASIDLPNTTTLHREPTLAHISTIQGSPPNPIAALSSTVTVAEILAQENAITQTT